MFRSVLVILALLSPSFASANDNAPPISIYLSPQCDNDTVGQRLIYRIREGVRRSSAMKLTESYIDSTVQIGLVCLDPGLSEKGYVSRFSYAISFLNHKGYYDYHLSHGIGACGSSRVDQCADDIVADLDMEIGKLRRRLRDGSFTPFDP
jgi:hypothetical protein